MSTCRRRRGQRLGEQGYINQVCELVRDVALGLGHGHEHGVVHRDVKPGNILVDQAGRPYITDFGLATVAGQPAVTVVGELLGTPLYMSPEQIAAGRVPVDWRTDIYSLGAVLYELLTLEPPHQGATRPELLHAIVFREPTPVRKLNPGVSADLTRVVQRALAKSPQRRYQSMTALAEDLERVMQGRRLRAGCAAGPMRWWHRRSVRLVMAAGLLVAIGGAWWTLSRSPKSPAGLSASQRAGLVRRAELAGWRGDWAEALRCYAGAWPSEPRAVHELQMRHGLARVAPVAGAWSGRADGVAAWSDDGRRMAFATGPQEAALVELDQPATAPVRLPHGPDDFLREVRVCAGGERVLTIGEFRVRVWSAAGRWLGEYAAAAERHIGRVVSAESGDVLFIATRSADADQAGETADLLRLDLGAGKYAAVSTVENVQDLDLDRAGAAGLVLTSAGAVLRVDADGGGDVRPVMLPAAATALRRVWWGRNTNEIVTLDSAGGWRLWAHDDDADDWEELAEHAGPVDVDRAGLERAAMAAIGGGRWLLTAWPTRGLAGGAWAVMCVGPTSAGVGELWTVDGLWTSRESDLCALVRGGSVEVRELGTEQTILRLGDDREGEPAVAGAVEWRGNDTVIIGAAQVAVDSSSGRVLQVVPADDGIGVVVRLWDIARGVLLGEWRRGGGSWQRCALLPGGDELLVEYAGGTVELWELGASMAQVEAVPATEISAGAMLGEIEGATAVQAWYLESGVGPAATTGWLVGHADGSVTVYAAEAGLGGRDARPTSLPGGPTALSGGQDDQAGSEVGNQLESPVENRCHNSGIDSSLAAVVGEIVTPLGRVGGAGTGWDAGGGG